jgi:hypothetical protein
MVIPKLIDASTFELPTAKMAIVEGVAKGRLPGPDIVSNMGNAEDKLIQVATMTSTLPELRTNIRQATCADEPAVLETLLAASALTPQRHDAVPTRVSRGRALSTPRSGA